MAWPYLTDSLVLSQVRTILGEPTERRISDTRLTRYLDRGCQIIAKRNKAYHAVASFALSDGTYEYQTGTTGMTDCIAVESVLYQAHASEGYADSGAKALLKMHPRHFQHIRPYTGDSDKGPPQEYAWFGTNLYIWPVADSSNRLTVLYYKAFDDLSGDNDLSSIPTHFGPYLIWYVYACALHELGKHQQALQYMSYFDNYLAYHMQIDDFNYNVDSEDMIRDLPDNTEFIQ